MIRVLVALFVVGASAAPARADKAKAEQYFRAGAQAYQRQSFAAAAEQFELAYKEAPLAEIAFSAAQAYRRLYYIEPKREYVQRAVELYQAYLGEVKTGGRVGDAADGIAEMRRELEHLGGGPVVAPPPPPATRVAVSVVIGEPQAAIGELAAPAADTSGARATLDGKPVALFVPLDVAPGDHAIEVSAAGYFAVHESRRVVEGSTEIVEVRLVEQPARLVVHTEDGAEIAIDGRVLGTAPLAPPELRPGRHVLAVTARGRNPVVHELALGRGETHLIDVALVRTTQRRVVPWLGGAAIGLAALSASTAIYAIVADGKLANLEHARVTAGITSAQLADERRWGQRRDTARDAAYGFGGAAVVAGAVTAALYWFDVPRPTEHTAIVPVATDHAAAVVWLGCF